jgi:c(7)-type cytochrome triheme protein
MIKLISLMGLAAAVVLPVQAQDKAAAGKGVYDKTCAVCHGTGINGAPRFGNAGDWQPRLAGGPAKLYQSALKGTAKGMPAKGGNPNLSDADVKSAVDYMLAQVSAKAAPAKKEEAAAKAEKPAAAAAPAVPSAPASAPAAAPAAPVAPATRAAPAPAPAVASGDVNAFNRLLRPAGQRNLPPAQDGIHDPSVDGTHALQPPLAAFDKMPRANAGNRVNWVQALADKKIDPRWDRADPKAEPVVMDLNIVREVKGSMPDVVYPHKQHTEWLDCSNCHPAIFVPQKGANQISMAAILLGQKCGVCHGKVAFPVSECRLCHSKKKDQAPPTAAQAPAATPAGAAK